MSIIWLLRLACVARLSHTLLIPADDDGPVPTNWSHPQQEKPFDRVYNAGDKVVVRGSNAIVRNGPDSFGRYWVVFPSTGKVAGPEPQKNIQDARGSMFDLGDRVRWHGRAGVVVSGEILNSSGRPPHFVVQFNGSLEYLSTSEVREDDRLSAGDEVTSHGKLGLLQSNPSDDGMCQVVFVDNPAETVDIPLFDLRMRKPLFGIGEDVLTSQTNLAVVLFGPDSTWGYLVRYNNGTIDGPIPEVSLRAAPQLMIGEDVEVEGIKGIIVSGPSLGARFTVNLLNGSKVSVLGPAVHLESRSFREASNPWTGHETNILAARAHIEANEADSPLHHGRIRHVSVPDKGIFVASDELSSSSAAERAAFQKMRTTGSPAEAGAAARAAASAAGVSGKELDSVSFEAALHAVAAHVSPTANAIEVNAFLRAGVFAAGLAIPILSAYLSKVAEAAVVARAGVTEIAAAVRSAGESVGLPQKQSRQREQEIVAEVTSKFALRQGLAPEKIGYETLRAVEAVGTLSPRAKRKAGEVVMKAITEHDLKDGRDAAEIAISARAAAQVIGIPSAEAGEMAADAVVRGAALLDTVQEVGRTAVEATKAAENNEGEKNIFNEALVAALVAAREMAKGHRSLYEVVACAEEAAGIAGIRGPGLQRLAASASARAVAEQSMVDGLPPREAGLRAKVAASAAGLPGWAVAQVASKAAVRAVTDNLILRGEGIKKTTKAAAEAASAAGTGANVAEYVAIGVAAAATHKNGDILTPEQIGRTAKDAVAGAGLTGQIAWIVAARAAESEVFSNGIREKLQPIELVNKMKIAAENAGLRTVHVARFVAGDAPILAAEYLAKSGKSATEIGLNAATYGLAAGVRSLAVDLQAGASAAAIAARRSASTGASAAVVSRTAVEALGGAGVLVGVVPLIASAAAAGACSWKAAADGELPSEIGRRALAAAEAAGLGKRDATIVASDAAGPAALASMTIWGDQAKLPGHERQAAAIRNALSAAGVQDLKLHYQAARSIAKHVAEMAAAKGQRADDIGRAVVSAVNDTGLLSPSTRYAIGAAAASASARYARRFGASLSEATEIAESTKYAAGLETLGGGDAQTIEANQLAINEVVNQVVRREFVPRFSDNASNTSVGNTVKVNRAMLDKVAAISDAIGIAMMNCAEKNLPSGIGEEIITKLPGRTVDVAGLVRRMFSAVAGAGTKIQAYIAPCLVALMIWWLWRFCGKVVLDRVAIASGERRRFIRKTFGCEYLALEEGTKIAKRDWFPENKFRGPRLVIILEGAALELAIAISKGTSLGSDAEADLAEFNVVYKTLAVLLEGPLNAAGLLLVYLRSASGVWVEVNPNFHLPKTLLKFARFSAEVFRRGQIGRGGGHYSLLTVLPDPLCDLPEKGCFVGCVTAGSDHLGKTKLVLENNPYLTVDAKANGPFGGKADDIFVFIVHNSTRKCENWSIPPWNRYQLVGVGAPTSDSKSSCAACVRICSEFAKTWGINSAGSVSPRV